MRHYNKPVQREIDKLYLNSIKYKAYQSFRCLKNLFFLVF